MTKKEPTNKLLQEFFEYFKEKSGVAWFIFIIAFFSGSGLGGLATFMNIGPGQEVLSLQQDMRGISCYVVAIQENRDSRLCEFLMSDDTRELMNELRDGQAPPLPPERQSMSMIPDDRFLPPQLYMKELKIDWPIA